MAQTIDLGGDILVVQDIKTGATAPGQSGTSLAATDSITGGFTALNATATASGGTTTAGLAMGTAGIGVFFGSGAPTITAPKGSLYLRTDGSSTSTRAYINTDGSTTWTAITTAG